MWKTIKDTFEQETFGFCTSVCLFTFLLINLLFLVRDFATPDTVQCYYIKASLSNSIPNYSIIGRVDWGEDIYRYFTQDYALAKAELATLKECECE